LGLLASNLPAEAGSLVVAPTTIKLSSPNEIGVLYLTNHGSEQVAAQVEAFDWTQPGGTDHLEPSQHLLISPPLAKIAPGATQTVRFQARTGATAKENGYRLLISEIPDASVHTALGVSILLQFSVPVFVAGQSKAPHAVVWDAALEKDGLVVTARNDGATHIKLSEIDLLSSQGTPPLAQAKELSYLLPGTKRAWNFPLRDVAEGAHIRIEGREQKNGDPITADLVVHR
jgi:fimbrial chaperone protein